MTLFKIRKRHLISKYYINISLSNMSDLGVLQLQGKESYPLYELSWTTEPVTDYTRVSWFWHFVKMTIASLQICKVWSMEGDTFNLFLPLRVRRDKPKNHKCFASLKTDLNAVKQVSSELCRARNLVAKRAVISVPRCFYSSTLRTCRSKVLSCIANSSSVC